MNLLPSILLLTLLIPYYSTAEEDATPSIAPSFAPICNASTPCFRGEYCDFSILPSGQGTCLSCLEVDPPMWDSCFGNSNTTQECISSCFPDYACSLDEPCEEDEGLWCTYQIELEETGVCANCSGMLYPGDCTNLVEAVAGQGACLDQCFEACDDTDDTCVDQDGFCHWIKGPNAENGYCEGCDRIESGNPFDCFLLIDDSTSAENCALDCFGECTLQDGGCQNETLFCAYNSDINDAGYCMNCTDVYDVTTCFEQAASDEAKEHCALTCFGTCNKDTPCAEGFYCNFEKGAEGYCSRCSTLTEAMDCTTLSRDAQESCVTSCYQVCSANQSCPSYVDFDHVFCDFQLNNGTIGACADCPFPDPGMCQVWNPSDTTRILTEQGQASCVGTCFRPCKGSSVIEDCGFGHTCTTNGFCLPFPPLPSLQVSNTPAPSIAPSPPFGTSLSSTSGAPAFRLLLPLALWALLGLLPAS